MKVLCQNIKRGGGDTVWQISTGYFGCRNKNGRFDEKLFIEKAQLPQVKMIEIKLSQGAKPGHGGMLLGASLTGNCRNPQCTCS